MNLLSILIAIALIIYGYTHKKKINYRDIIYSGIILSILAFPFSFILGEVLKTTDIWLAFGFSLSISLIISTINIVLLLYIGKFLQKIIK